MSFQVNVLVLRQRVDGKDIIGWYFGFGLHLVVNDAGDILAFRVTLANCGDRSLVNDMMQGLFGRFYGDKGYISKNDANN